MYRAVTYYVIENKLYEGKIINEEALKKDLDAGKINIDFRYNPELKQSETYLNGKHIEREIRGIEVSNLVSPVAVIPFVRKKLVDLQRAKGKEGGIVMDGRDIGTNVFPNAASVRCRRLPFHEIGFKVRHHGFQLIVRINGHLRTSIPPAYSKLSSSAGRNTDSFSLLMTTSPLKKCAAARPRSFSRCRGAGS